MEIAPNSTESGDSVGVGVDPVTVIGEKRPFENVGESELGVQLVKKPRIGSGTDGDMRRVAEIVLVLSTMRNMGGGRKPTAVEIELMAEARAKVAEMCKELLPKDILSREAIGSVIEDLGLNGKIKDQRLGFRGPKLTISEKMSLTKRKMEESKKFAAHSSTYSSPSLQSGFGAVAGNRGPQHTVAMFPSDKSSNVYVPTSAGGFPASTPLGHVSVATSMPMSHHLPINEVKESTVSSGLPSSHLGRSSSLLLPRVDRVPLKVDGGSNESPQASQIRANSSADRPLVNAPTWSVDPHSALSAKRATENKVSSHTFAKVDGINDTSMLQMSPQAAKDQTFRPYITQTASGNLPIQGMNFVHAPPPINHHNEIAQIVQKVLQPKLPGHPTWIPPSREYMNKAFACNICMLTITEMDNVLLCDACEKGYHIKCLHPYNPKSIPRGEWHCPKCLQLSNGKPLPPKYGRVMRNMNAPKLPTNASGVQSSSEKKEGTLDSKLEQQKFIANESSNSQPPAFSGAVSSNCVGSASDSKIPNGSEMLRNHVLSSQNGVDDKPISGTCANISVKSLEATCTSPPVGSSSEKSSQHFQMSESSRFEERSISDTRSEPPASLTNTVTYNTDHLQHSEDPQNIDRSVLPNCPEVPSKHENISAKNLEKPDTGERVDCVSRPNTKQDDQDVVQANPGAREQAEFSSDGLRDVEWIGNVFQIVDGKMFYQSCFIDGVSYKVHDHALFRFSCDKLVPSKLQTMWEDCETGLKWIAVNRCYFPDDLPDVGHPCSLDSNEVYESNHESIVMAGLIQGPCEVLPTTKFEEESERRIQLGTNANNGLRPVFLSKWFYDEIKGSFQPISS